MNIGIILIHMLKMCSENLLSERMINIMFAPKQIHTQEKTVTTEMQFPKVLNCNNYFNVTLHDTSDQCKYVNGQI